MMSDRQAVVQRADPEEQAEFVRGLVRESDLFDPPIDMDDPDAVLVAAYIVGVVERWEDEQ